MEHKGKISRVYYFSPHEGLLSKIVLEVRAENGEDIKVEKIGTQEELAKQFGFRIKEPHVWDTRSLDKRDCVVDINEKGEARISYL